MFLTAAQIARNTAWLLANASAPVRFLAHRDLLGAAPPPALWQGVERDPDVAAMFAAQQADGSWCAGGPWAQPPSYTLQSGGDPYTPKYVTTVWLLPLLGEVGYTVADPRIRRACDYTLSHGYFAGPLFRQPFEALDARLVERLGPCRFSQYLIALGSVGAADEPLARRGYEVLLAGQRDDGGWALEQHYQERRWTRSCPWSSYHATMALYHAHDPAYRDALTRGLQFLVRHLGGKTEDEQRRWFYHGHSPVRELLALSEYGVGLDSALTRTLLAWLLTLYDAAQGRLRYAGRATSRYTHRQDGMDARVARYRLYHLVEDDWLTYHATRIARNLLS